MVDAAHMNITAIYKQIHLVAVEKAKRVAVSTFLFIIYQFASVTSSMYQFPSCLFE
jgi:hypothetical protein